MSDCPKCLRPLHNCICSALDYPQDERQDVRNDILDELTKDVNKISEEILCGSCNRYQIKVLNIIKNKKVK